MQTIVIEGSLHPAQEPVWMSTARFRVVGCGRRWGKTHLGVLEIIDHCVNVEGAIAWWISPTHDQSKIAWRMFRAAVGEDAASFNETEKVAIFHHNGARVQFKSADRDKNLRGEGLTFVVLDEGAFLKESTWYGSIRPSLSDRKGGALIIGTFDGTENWFYLEYERGQDPTDTEIESWRFPTSANPYIDEAEIEAARRTLPEAEFAQEYLADPMIFVGAVFAGRFVQSSIDLGKHVKVDRELPKFAGIDWGYSNATVIEVCQEYTSGHVDWIDERSWVATQLDTRVDSIVELIKAYKIETAYADAAGASENAKLLAALQDEGLETMLVRVPFGKKTGRGGETLKDAGIKTRRWYLENVMESMTPQVPELIRTTKKYKYKEGTEDVEKTDDHPVDAATCFYASRRSRVVEEH